MSQGQVKVRVVGVGGSEGGDVVEAWRGWFILSVKEAISIRHRYTVPAAEEKAHFVFVLAVTSSGHTVQDPTRSRGTGTQPSLGGPEGWRQEG